MFSFLSTISNPIVHGPVVALTYFSQEVIPLWIQYCFWVSAAIQVLTVPFRGYVTLGNCGSNSSTFTCGLSVTTSLVSLIILTATIYTAVYKVGITNKALRKKILQIRIQTMPGMSPLNQFFFIFSLVVAIALVPFIASDQ
ncbi:hypothetical protein RNJ44_00348 [Nakaseomyces bracarensis]|uniref:Uncharacterized protein n=1 Tax=Nakaseomyces bracarensis TaxID=273131 RepID=A0ABR4NSA1_9SACH